MSSDTTPEMPSQRRPRPRRDSPLPNRQPHGGSAGDWMRLAGMLATAGIIGGGGGGVLGAYGASSLIEYRIEQLERDLAEHEDHPHIATQREIDRVAAEARAVDERRQSDLRLVTDRLERIDGRLGRIEEALDGRRR